MSDGTIPPHVYQHDQGFGDCLACMRHAADPVHIAAPRGDDELDAALEYLQVRFAGTSAGKNLNTVATALATAKGERDRLLGKGREQVDEGAELIGTVGELREALATQPEGRSVVIHDGWDWPFWVNGDDSFDEVVLFIAHPDGVGCVNIDAVDDLYAALSTAKGERDAAVRDVANLRDALKASEAEVARLRYVGATLEAPHP